MHHSFAAVLTLKKKARIDAGELITALRLFVEKSGATVRLDPRMMVRDQAPRGLKSLFKAAEPEVVRFELDGVRLRVTVVNEPYEKAKGVHRFVNPAMWNSGLGEFSDHRAHIVIHEAGIEGDEGPDAVFDRAASVTATASVIARLTEPVGIVWNVARNAVPMPIFFEAMDTLMGGRAPLKLWLRWYVIAPGEMDDLCSGIVTSGLAPFIGREIMAPPSEVEPRFMIEHAFEVARALLDDKRPLADAQVIDTEDGDKLRLKLRARVAGVEGPVCEITLPDPVARKRRAPVAPVQAADLLAAEEVGVRPPRSMQVNAAAAQAALGGPAASGASHQPSGAQNGAALPVQRTPPAAAPGSAPAAAPQPATEPYLLTDPVFVPDLPAGAPRAPAPSPETMPVLAPLNRDAGYSYAPPAAGPTREVASHDPAQHAQDPAAGGAAVPPDMGQPEWRPAAAPRPGGYDPLDPLGILPPQAPGRAAGGSPATGGVQAYDPVRARMALGYDPLDPMGYAAYRPGGQQGGSGSAGGSAGALGGPSRPAPDDTLLPPPRNPHAELFPEEPEEGERPELDRSRIRGISADWNGGAPPSRGDILGPDDSETRTIGERRIRVIPGGKSGR